MAAASSAFTFSEAELSVYGPPQLSVLGEVLRNGNADQISNVREAIGRKIGRVSGIVDERAFLEAYHEQLRRHLSVANSSPPKRWSSLFWVGGTVLLLAFCNYSGKDQAPTPADAMAGMSANEAMVYLDCMERSASYAISEYALSEICRKSALGLDTDLDCHTEWDGRMNPTTCQ